MPGLNKRGPQGEGPMTGRRLGRCTRFGAALQRDSDETIQPADDFPVGNAGTGSGWRHGRCHGHGRGNGNRYRFGQR